MIAFYLIVIAFLLLFPADTADTALRAIHIWGTSVVPILFPYMIFSRLLCKSLQTLSLPAGPATAFLGMLGGSPSGASMIVSNANRLHAQSIYPLCALTGTVSPMFILGAMQAWTNNASLCRILLLCHWLSALLCAWIIRAMHNRNGDAVFIQPSANNIPSNPIMQSIDAILLVGGCIICCSVLSGILGKLLAMFPFLQPFTHALLEVAGGIHAICQADLPDGAKSILLSASLGFGGLSILAQNHGMLRQLGISLRQLLCFAALRAAVSALLMAIALLPALN